MSTPIPNEPTQELPQTDWRQLGGPTPSEEVPPTAPLPRQPAPAPQTAIPRIPPVQLVPQVSGAAIAWYVLALSAAVLAILIGAGVHLSATSVWIFLLTTVGLGLVLSALATLLRKNDKAENFKSKHK